MLLVQIIKKQSINNTIQGFKYEFWSKLVFDSKFFLVGTLHRLFFYFRNSFLKVVRVGQKYRF